MDNYREKILRIVERELKRTEEYQQRRDEYGNEEYILGCIMVKGDAFPKEVIAHAFVEDMGLELQFQICLILYALCPPICALRSLAVAPSSRFIALRMAFFPYFFLIASVAACIFRSRSKAASSAFCFSSSAA